MPGMLFPHGNGAKAIGARTHNDLILGNNCALQYFIIAMHHCLCQKVAARCSSKGFSDDRGHHDQASAELRNAGI